MLGRPILAKHYPKPIVGGLRGAVKVGDTSFKSPKKASALAVYGSFYGRPTLGKL
jgi:hypothetical protein